MPFERRRCQGNDCTRPIVMGGPRQSRIYFTRASVGGRGVDRLALCWACYDLARGNVPRAGVEHQGQRP